VFIYHGPHAAYVIISQLFTTTLYAEEYNYKAPNYTVYAITILSVCLCIRHITFWMTEPIYLKLGICNMAAEPIVMAHFIYLSHQPVCLYVYPPDARQRLGKNFLNAPRHRLGENVTAATNTHATKNCWEHQFLCSPCSMKESRRLVLPRTSYSKLAGSSSVLDSNRRLINLCSGTLNLCFFFRARDQLSNT
jgi:hypothetical protein